MRENKKMTAKIIPWNFKPVEQKWKEYNEVFFDQVEFMEKKLGMFLPIEGHRILIKAVKVPEKTKSGIYMSDMSKELGAISYDMGLVVGIGIESYKDTERFPYGPRCKLGDWIDFSPFEKQKKRFNGHFCWFINDDRVNAPVPDISKAVSEFNKFSIQEIDELHNDNSNENNSYTQDLLKEAKRIAL